MLARVNAQYVLKPFMASQVCIGNCWQRKMHIPCQCNHMLTLPSQSPDSRTNMCRKISCDHAFESPMERAINNHSFPGRSSCPYAHRIQLGLISPSNQGGRHGSIVECQCPWIVDTWTPGMLATQATRFSSPQQAPDEQVCSHQIVS